MHFGVLGSLEVSDGDGPVALGGPKQRLILAHLVLSANRVVPAEQLVDAVWGEEPPSTAKRTVQAYVSRLRSALGSGRIEGRTSGYLLHADPSDVDALRFEHLLREARGDAVEPASTVLTLTEALELWRGPALADLSGEPSLAGDVARLEELRLQATEEKIAAELELGRHADAVASLEALTRAHPLRERLWGELMLSLYREGRQADALSAYERARSILADELGIDPSRELRLLHERILRQDEDLELQGAPLRGYRLLEQIGEGAFGIVHRAVQPQVGREVAIKAIHPGLANHPDFVRSFEREAQLVARLEHPHIVPLYDYWREPEAAYLVMRFLRGGSLADLVDAGPLELARVAGILDQVAAALAAAHRQGVVHRDVKPENVLLDEEGNAYLTDFGVALDAGAAEKTSGAMMRGTPAYLSPEQIRMESATPQSDVYALGIVLYEMLTGAHPFAETSLTALLERHLSDPLPSVREARPELSAAVEAVIARATAKDPGARSSDAVAVAVAFRAAIDVPGVVRVPVGEVRNPYKGLRAFSEADADDFFGREEDIERLVARLRQDDPAARFLAVVGPSGSGKSSVVRAGLVPALRRGAVPGSERWYVIEMLPGAHPFAELRSALLGIAVEPPSSLTELLERDELGLVDVIDRTLPDPDAELLIVLDQLEEVFTLVEDDGEATRFLESIRAAALAPGSRIRVVATLRADFYDQPLSVPGFGDLLAARNEAITPMSPEELELAIVAPANRAGLVVEPMVLAAMIGDVADRPGALPLLQYALTELAERAEGGVLGIDAYQAIGRVSGALARRAEHLFEALNDAGQVACRQLFLRLVTLGEGSEDTRRRVRRSELLPLAEAKAMESVIEAFGRHRLLSFDRDPSTREPTVEIAHEALLGAWARLRGWIDEARDDIRAERQVAAAATEWKESERDPSFLLRGARLEQVSSWTEATTLTLSDEDRVYVDASLHEQDEERRVERERVEKQRALERRSVNRLRALVAVLTAAFLVAGTLTAVALNRNASAERAVRLATARELAGAALRVLDSDTQLATLLALESIDTSAEDGVVALEAEFALRQAWPQLAVKSLGGRLLGVSWTPDLGRIAIVAESGPTAVWEFTSGQPGRRVFSVPTEDGSPLDCPDLPASGGRRFPPCDAVFHAALSPDGSLLATGHGDRFVRIWDIASGRSEVVLDAYAQLLPRSEAPGDVAPAVGFSPDGRYLWTLARYGDGVVWDASTGEEILRAPDHLRLGKKLFLGVPGDISFSRDSRFVAFEGLGTEVWDVGTRQLVLQDQDASYGWPPPSFTDEGVVTIGGGIYSIGLESVIPEVDVPDLPDAPQAQMADFDFSPDGTRFAAASTQIRVWDVETQEYVTLGSVLGPLKALAWSPDSRYLATGWIDGTARIWDVDAGTVAVTIPTAPGAVVDLAFTPDGASLAVASEDGTVALYVLDQGDLIELARDRVSRELTDEECREYLHAPSCPANG